VERKVRSVHLLPKREIQNCLGEQTVFLRRLDDDRVPLGHEFPVREHPAVQHTDGIDAPEPAPSPLDGKRATFPSCWSSNADFFIAYSLRKVLVPLHCGNRLRAVNSKRFGLAVQAPLAENIP